MKRVVKGGGLLVVTANALTTGLVVFRTPGAEWSVNIADALVVESGEAAEAQLAAALGDVAADLVVEPYLVAVDVTGEGPRPLLLRERIRALRGPTIAENRTLPDAMTC